jgi:hypothetical protein
MQGFISYTHRNARHLDRLAVHFRAIERMTRLTFWYDKRRLTGGDHFDDSIIEAIGHSEFFVLLVSPDFFDSDYIFDKEIPAITERSQEKNCPVVPVILQRCLWEAWLEGLLAVPNLPILEWRPQEHGFDAANREVVKKLYSCASLSRLHYSRPFLQKGRGINANAGQCKPLARRSTKLSGGRSAGNCRLRH